MRFKVYRLSCLLACSLFIGGLNVAMAADTAEPSYQNTAQEQNTAQDGHAANLNEAALPAAEDDLAETQATSDQAYNDWQTALNDPAASPETIAALESAYKSAEQARQEAQDRFDGLKDGSLVDSLRASGMGWGEIAHELGVHPGTLGLGHTKDKGLKSSVTSANISDETATSGKADKSAGGNGNKGGNGGGGNGGGGNGGGGNGGGGNGGGGGKGK